MANKVKRLNREVMVVLKDMRPLRYPPIEDRRPLRQPLIERRAAAKAATEKYRFFLSARRYYSAALGSRPEGGQESAGAGQDENRCDTHGVC